MTNRTRVQRDLLVVVDIDGVLFSTPQDAVAASNAAHNTAYEVSDIFDHDAVHNKSIFTVEGTDQFHHHQHDIDKYRVIANAKEVLARLRAQSVRFVALTSRNPEIFKDETIAAIRNHFKLGYEPECLIQEVMFASGFGGDAKLEKGEVVRQLGGRVLVDDAVRYCKSAERHGVAGILLSQPYNRIGHDWPAERTANDWLEAEKMIEQILFEDE